MAGPLGCPCLRAFPRGASHTTRKAGRTALNPQVRQRSSCRHGRLEESANTCNSRTSVQRMPPRLSCDAGHVDLLPRLSVGDDLFFPKIAGRRGRLENARHQCELHRCRLDNFTIAEGSPPRTDGLSIQPHQQTPSGPGSYVCFGSFTSYLASQRMSASRATSDMATSVDGCMPPVIQGTWAAREAD